MRKTQQKKKGLLLQHELLTGSISAPNAASNSPAIMSYGLWIGSKSSSKCVAIIPVIIVREKDLNKRLAHESELALLLLTLKSSALKSCGHRCILIGVATKKSVVAA